MRACVCSAPVLICSRSSVRVKSRVMVYPFTKLLGPGICAVSSLIGVHTAVLGGQTHTLRACVCSGAVLCKQNLTRLVKLVKNVNFWTFKP